MDEYIPTQNSDSDFECLRKRFNPIEGWLDPREGFVLMKFAEEGPGKGEVVEIGSLLSRSTCWLAEGVKRRRKGKVSAVDHFKGSPEHQPGQPYEIDILSGQKTMPYQFLKNIKLVGLSNYIVPIKATSADAAKHWTKKIRLLFIDGDHSYVSTKQDFFLWFPYVCDRGIICFHDIETEWEGCTAFYQELTASSKSVKEIAAVESLRAVQKTVSGNNKG